MRTPRAAKALALACAMVLGAATPAAAVTGGVVDGSAHPYVGMLFGPGAATPSCSGVLVQSDNGGLAVLTAAHCLHPSGARSGSGWTVELAPFDDPANPRYTGTWYVDSSYQPSVSPAHDLAAIVLDAPPAVPAAVLAPGGREDNAPDADLTVVGTGQPHVGQRRSATEHVVRRDGTWTYLVPGTGNSCDGDSGGPDLVPGSDVVVALTDLGTCSSDQDLRVDTGEAHRLLVTATQASGAPLVVTQPAGQQVRAGSPATFSAAAQASPPAAQQWQGSTDGGTTWVDLSGETGPQLTVTPARPQSGEQYRAVFTNAEGVDRSGAATLTVTSDAGSGTAGLYHPLTPRRVLDTRAGGGRVTAGSDRPATVLGAGGVPSAGVGAVVLGVVVPQPAAAGDLQVYPTGSRPSPRTSNLNWPAGRTVAGLVTVPPGPDGTVTLSVSAGAVDVGLDVVGWYGDSSDPAGARYTPVVPARVLDTGGGAGAVVAGSDRRLQLRGAGGVPDRSDVTAVALNLTVLGARAPVDVEVYPGDSEPRLRTSNTNLVAGQTASVAVAATLGPRGDVLISVGRGSLRVLADVLGYWSASGDRFVPLTPVRVLDRALVTAGADLRVVLAGSHGIPAGADAVVLNATGTAASQALDVELYPAGRPPARRTSVLNLLPGQAVPDLVPAGLAGAALALSSSGGHLLVTLDALGYLTAG